MSKPERAKPAFHYDAHLCLMVEGEEKDYYLVRQPRYGYESDGERHYWRVEDKDGEIWEGYYGTRANVIDHLTNWCGFKLVP